MKFLPENRRMCRLVGMGLAAAMLATCLTAQRTASVRVGRTTVTGSRTGASNATDGKTVGTVDIPFHQKENGDAKGNAEKLYQIYTSISQSEKAGGKTSVTVPSQPVGESSGETDEMTDTAQAPESTTASTTASTTVTTTLSSRASETEGTKPTAGEETVSNGKAPFNYRDVTSIAPHLDKLSDFVEQLGPVSFSWNTQDYATKGCVRISLASSAGSVTLDVKPNSAEPLEPYAIGGETVGSVNVSSLGELDWYRQNSDSGACIRTMTWFREEYPVAPVRGIGIGTGLAELTARYLCVNGGATTLYKASDVISDEEKLNALLSSENAYTFVGGRIYTVERYLEKYYSGSDSSYQFEDCDMVVQYGCNSITEHNYTTGSWLMEYAMKDDTVVGITFMNKSYYEPDFRRGETVASDQTGSTSVTSGGGESMPTAGTTRTDASENAPEATQASGNADEAPSVTEASVFAESGEEEGVSGDSETARTPADTVLSSREEEASEAPEQTDAPAGATSTEEQVSS